MIQFYREGNKVKMKVEHGIFGSDEFFEIELQQEFKYQAELLKRQLQDNLDAHLKEIKENAYNQGWKDAKAKTRKRKWNEFFGGWKF